MALPRSRVQRLVHPGCRALARRSIAIVAINLVSHEGSCHFSSRITLGWLPPPGRSEAGLDGERRVRATLGRDGLERVSNGSELSTIGYIVSFM